jgi:hypothetical protein
MARPRQSEAAAPAVAQTTAPADPAEELRGRLAAARRLLADKRAELDKVQGELEAIRAVEAEIAADLDGPTPTLAEQVRRMQAHSAEERRLAAIAARNAPPAPTCALDQALGARRGGHGSRRPTYPTLVTK